VFCGKLENRALNPAGPSGQHSLCTRVQLDTGWIRKDGVVAAVVGTRDGCPVVLPLDEDALFGGGDGDEVIEVGEVFLVLEVWYPVGPSRPGPFRVSPEPGDREGV
jgi:hypothetical protein